MRKSITSRLRRFFVTHKHCVAHVTGMTELCKLQYQLHSDKIARLGHFDILNAQTGLFLAIEPYCVTVDWSVAQCKLTPRCHSCDSYQRLKYRVEMGKIIVTRCLVFLIRIKIQCWYLHCTHMYLHCRHVSLRDSHLDIQVCAYVWV